MQIKFLRKLLWVTNTLLVLGIVAYALFFFILGGARKRGAQPAEKILGGRLPSAAPDVEQKKLKPWTLFGPVHELVIDGEPPVEVTQDPEAGPVETVPPLARDYKLRWIAVNLRDPSGSWAHLEYTSGDKKLVTVQVGEFVEYTRTLQRKDGDWQLVSVELTETGEEKAVFRREDSDESVTLLAERAEPGQLGKGAPGEPKALVVNEGPGVGLYQKQPRERPTREAIEIRDNEFEVPPEEQSWWSDYGEEELTDKVALETAKVGGKAVGLMFKSVEKKSMVARRGVKSGDILKSINGKPVRSRQEVINYVNGEGKGLKTYTILIERNGKDITKTYHVKKKK
jgi:hypothetical protein